MLEIPADVPLPRRRWAAIAAAALAVYAAELAGWLPTVAAGIVPVGAATTAGVLLLAALDAAWCRPVRTQDRSGAVVLVLVALLLAAATPGPAGGATILGVLAATAAEEGLFRVAPVLLAARGRPGWSRRTVGTVAATVSTTVFVLLPGHLAQLDRTGPAGVVGFVAAALILWTIVWRLQRPWTAAAVHAVVDQATLATLAGGLSTVARAVILATVLGVVVLGGLRSGGWRPATTGTTHDVRSA